MSREALRSFTDAIEEQHAKAETLVAELQRLRQRNKELFDEGVELGLGKRVMQSMLPVLPVWRGGEANGETPPAPQPEGDGMSVNMEQPANG